MKLLRTLAFATLLCAPLSMAGCASASGGVDVQTTLTLVQQGFTAAQVLYNSVCSVNTNLYFCSAEDMDTANAAANLVRQAIQTTKEVIAAGGTAAQIDAALQGVLKAEADFERIINRLQATKSAALARAARQR